MTWSPRWSPSLTHSPPLYHSFTLFRSHGTRCAGEVAAARDNGICGVGVAYDSKIAGKWIWQEAITVHRLHSEKERSRAGAGVNCVTSKL